MFIINQFSGFSGGNLEEAGNVTKIKEWTGNGAINENIDLEDPDPNRWLIVALSQFDSVQLNTIGPAPIIDGTNMANVISQYNTDRDDGHAGAIYALHVPNGQEVNITYDPYNYGDTRYIAYRMVGVVPEATVYDSDAINTNHVDINTPSDGCAFAIAVANFSEMSGGINNCDQDLMSPNTATAHSTSVNVGATKNTSGSNTAFGITGGDIELTIAASWEYNIPSNN